MQLKGHLGTFSWFWADFSNNAIQTPESYNLLKELLYISTGEISNSWLYFLLECHMDLPWMRGALGPFRNWKIATHILENRKPTIKIAHNWKIVELQISCKLDTVEKDMYFSSSEGSHNFILPSYLSINYLTTRCSNVIIN